MARIPDATPEEQAGRDAKTGFFLPGHKIPQLAKERRDRIAESLRCPAALERRGLGGLWDLQIEPAKKGNASALSKLWDLVQKYGEEPERADVDSKMGHRYAGLPGEVAGVLRELDVGIADVVHRGALGLPMSDVEQLIYETAQAIRGGGPKCAAVTRWRGVLIREIQTLNNKKGTNDVKENSRQATVDSEGSATTDHGDSTTTPDGPTAGITATGANDASTEGSGRPGPTGAQARGHSGDAGSATGTEGHRPTRDDDDATGDQDHTGTIGSAASGQAEADDS